MATNEQLHLKKTAGCVHYGPAVADRLHVMGPHIDPVVRLHLLERLVMGERKYGTVLRVGWKDAPVELYQEFLDAAAYAIALDDARLAARLCHMASDLRRKFSIAGNAK